MSLLLTVKFSVQNSSKCHIFTAFKITVLYISLHIYIYIYIYLNITNHISILPTHGNQSKFRKLSRKKATNHNSTDLDTDSIK
jgi:hypothetical protein